MDKIYSLIQERYNEFNIIGLFLYGSQNYGLDYTHSDMDFIALVKQDSRPHREMEISNGKLKIYTIKYFLYRLKRGDLECYEILYTKYKILNPRYEDLFEYFINNYTPVINYDRIKRSLRNKLSEHLGYVTWMISNKEKAYYNKKRLYWAIRVYNQLTRIEAGEDFASSLIYKDNLDLDLMKIKTETNFLSVNELNKIYKLLATYLQNKPQLAIEVTPEEERCFSWLYSSIS